LRRNHHRRLHQFFRCLKLAFGVDDFSRRARSDSAWPAIARFMPSGKTTSLTFTAVTLIPHGSVCRSMISCSLRFILPRCYSSSSSSACPSTLRNVVCEMSEVAFR
jgi:hypothetical protein